MLGTSFPSKVVLHSGVRGSKDKGKGVVSPLPDSWYSLIKGLELGKGLHLPCGRRRQDRQSEVAAVGWAARGVLSWAWAWAAWQNQEQKQIVEITRRQPL